MKKINFIFITIIMLLTIGLTSCGNKDYKFYSLKDAYLYSILTDEDLEDIANYHNNNISLEISNKDKRKIINTRLKEMKSEEYPNGEKRHPHIKFNEISIAKYYGEYNGAHVVMLEDDCTIFLEVEDTDNIGGIEFNYSNSNRILVWSNETEYIKYLKQFDLEDKKEIWQGSINDSFENDSIVIVLKYSDYNPEFKLEYLNIDEALDYEYLMGGSSTTNFIIHWQIIRINLIPQEKERIIEIIREVEKLEFIKSAEPDMIYSTSDN